MYTRSLAPEDEPALQALLMREPRHNLFHLSALREHGLAPAGQSQGRPWAIGVLGEGGELVGALVALRGTGCIFHEPDDDETLGQLAECVLDRGLGGSLSLLSGHATQIEPLIPLIGEAGLGHADRCYFRTLYPAELVMPGPVPGFGLPRLASDGDMDRLIDFYEVGFYSLAHLPSRAAWRNRLAEQLAFRTLFVMEDAEGCVASAALSSAEGGGTAMLGGVATLDRYRGLGLSALCVGALCDYLFLSGAQTVNLFYLHENAPAGRVYDKLGFRYDGEWLLVPLGLGASFGPLLGLRSR